MTTATTPVPPPPVPPENDGGDRADRADGVHESQDARPRPVETHRGGPSLAAGGDLLPLSTRVWALMALRAGICAVLAALVWARPETVGAGAPPVGGWGVLYLSLSAVTSLVVVRLSSRAAAVTGFGLLLMLDGLAVQAFAHTAAGTEGSDLLLAVHLAAVCLLASFRTGIKIAVWLSLLVVGRSEATALGLLADTGSRNAADEVLQLVLIWVLTLVVCQAAALNERELRRRRHDAEALQSFAVDLHRDETVETVLARLCSFLARHADARRVVVCTRTGGQLTLLAEHGATLAHLPSGSTRSALLARAADPSRPALALDLDPGTDPFLALLMPRARRLVAWALSGPDEPPVWVVIEHDVRGTLVERRVLSTVGQAVGGVRLALSRARLFHQAQMVAHTDGLTGVANRRAFDDEIAAMCGPGHVPATSGLVLVDIDHFKAINDRFGHQSGDVALRQVAAVLSEHAPAGALVARYGGEEFGVLLPRTEGVVALATAERMRVAVSAIAEPVAMTASFGVALTSPEAPLGVSRLVGGADAALYAAKEGGRDRVVLHGATPPEAPDATPAVSAGTTADHPRGAGPDQAAPA